MDTERVTVDKAEALRLYRKYKEHRAYSAPIDWEVQRTYQLLASGKTIIRALASVTAAGLDEEYLPKLALCKASAKTCFLTRFARGSATMSTTNGWRQTKSNAFNWRAESFKWPHDSFPMNWDGKSRAMQAEHSAQVPLVPVHLRPKRGLENYHVLWEAEWHKLPPRDPYLLRRIGQADLWLVVAHWDLTEVERAALATRIGA